MTDPVSFQTSSSRVCDADALGRLFSLFSLSTPCSVMDFQQWLELLDSGFKGCQKVFKVLIIMDENESSKCSAHI